MKQLFYLFLVLVLLGCEDSYEDTHRYSKLITQSKQYPVYLDMSEMGNIQVTAKSPLSAPFKILSNDRYYFMGEMLKGVHVYEKKTAGASYLCFIECRYIKDFELVGNRLFCNNLVDMVVVDVSNPLQINTLHRQKNHFNRFTSYKKEWNIPYMEGKGIIAGAETHELTGVITDIQPELDFSEFDQLYGNLTTKVIPDTWFSNFKQKHYDHLYLNWSPYHVDDAGLRHYGGMMLHPEIGVKVPLDENTDLLITAAYRNQKIKSVARKDYNNRQFDEWEHKADLNRLSLGVAVMFR
jgi:hypothetical protein